MHPASVKAPSSCPLRIQHIDLYDAWDENSMALATFGLHVVKKTDSKAHGANMEPTWGR